MKRIIDKETIANIQAAYNNAVETGKVDCKEYMFSNVMSFTIGLVQVVKHGDTSMLILKPEATKEYMSEWKNDVGNIMARDFKKNIAQGKYFEFKAGGSKALLRKIDDTELKDFHERGFDDLKLGDYHYTVCMYTSADKSYISQPTKYADTIIDTDDVAPESQNIIKEEDMVSVSLFN